jgi:hypothetical protein
MCNSDFACKETCSSLESGLDNCVLNKKEGVVEGKCEKKVEKDGSLSYVLRI